MAEGGEAQLNQGVAQVSAEKTAAIASTTPDQPVSLATGAAIEPIVNSPVQIDDKANVSAALPEDIAVPDIQDQQEALKMSKENANKSAQRLLREKKRELSRLDEANMTDEQFALYGVALLEENYPQRDYKHIDPSTRREKLGIEMNVRVMTVENPPREVDVTLLKAGKGKKKERIYTCYAKDPADSTKTIEVSVAGEELATKYMAVQAESIAKNFSDAGEEALIVWNLRGGEEPLPEEARAAAVKESEPMNRADRIITRQIAQLDEEIPQLEKLLAESKSGEERKAKTALLAKRRRLRGALSFALEANGQEYGSFAKHGALEQINAAATEQSDSLPLDEDEQVGLDECRDLLKPQAEQAREDIIKGLQDAGVPQADLDALGTGEVSLEDLMQNKNLLGPLLSIEGIDQKIFGRSLQQQEMLDIISKSLSPEQKAALRAAGIDINAAEGAKGLLWILLMIAGGLIVLTAGAVLAVEGEVVKEMGPQR